MATPRGKPKLPARLLARPLATLRGMRKLQVTLRGKLRGMRLPAKQLATLRGMRKLQVTLLATKLPAKQLVRPLATLAACGE